MNEGRKEGRKEGNDDCRKKGRTGGREEDCNSTESILRPKTCLQLYIELWWVNLGCFPEYKIAGNLSRIAEFLRGISLI